MGLPPYVIVLVDHLIQFLEIPLTELPLILVRLSRSSCLPREVELYWTHVPELAGLNTKVSDRYLVVFGPVDVRYVGIISTPSSGSSEFPDLGSRGMNTARIA